MSDTQALNRQLLQTNRLLKLGYAGLCIAVITGYVVAQDDTGEEAQAPAAAPAVIDINSLGTTQMITGVENPDGFAVVVDEAGTINVVHRDGTVIVPNRKIFSHVYQDEHEHGPRFIELP